MTKSESNALATIIASNLFKYSMKTEEKRSEATAKLSHSLFSEIFQYGDDSELDIGDLMQLISATANESLEAYYLLHWLGQLQYLFTDLPAIENIRIKRNRDEMFALWKLAVRQAEISVLYGFELCNFISSAEQRKSVQKLIHAIVSRGAPYSLKSVYEEEENVHKKSKKGSNIKLEDDEAV